MNFHGIGVIHGWKSSDVRINFMSRTFNFNKISQAQICDETVGQLR